MSKYDPKVAIKYEPNLPIDYLLKNEDILGPVSHLSKINPVGNTQWDYLYFTDSSVFSPAANAFKESKLKTKGTNMDPSYTEYPLNTKAYKDFWREEKRRCKKGYEVGGVWIPGEYYFYLNYCLIKKTDMKTKSENLDFPDFTAMDYYYFLELDRADNNPDMTLRRNMVVAKARRKGYSFKNAGGCVYKYTFFKESKVVIAAQYGAKARYTFDMCLDMIDFLNQYTEFRSPYYARSSNDNHGFIKAGAKVKTADGKEFIKGRKTEIHSISLQDKPDAAAGFGAIRVILEEAGMIKDLKSVFRFTDPVLRDGQLRKGIMIMFGTGGDMENAKEFSEIFYNPKSYHCLEYSNIYEENSEATSCGWFVDDMWYRPGSVHKIDGKIYEAFDKNGNALKWVAELDMNRERNLAKKSSQKDLEIELSQYCKNPSEAFLISKGNVFPVPELYKRLVELRKNSDIAKPYRAGQLIETNGKVIFSPDLGDKLQPLDNYPLKPDQKNLEGCILQYYAPEYINGVIPDDAYIIGHDPWGLDAKLASVERDSSVGAAYVMRTNKYFKEMGIPGMIVASYIGRTERMDEYNYNLYKLCKYYNAKLMFENDRGEIEPYFTKQKALHHLAIPPFNIIKKHGQGSAMHNRRYGFSSSSIKFKQIAIQYVKDWLIEKRLENDYLTNIDMILDKALLEELIQFSFDHGNFDRIMALVGCVLYLENNSVVEAITKTTDNKYRFLTNNKRFFYDPGEHFEASDSE